MFKKLCGIRNYKLSDIKSPYKVLCAFSVVCNMLTTGTCKMSSKQSKTEGTVMCGIFFPCHFCITEITALRRKGP